MLVDVDLTTVPFDPAGLMRTLADGGVEFVVIGGVAALLQGATVDTRDMDVAVREVQDNFDALATALRSINGRLLIGLNWETGMAQVIDLPIAASTFWDSRPTRLLTDHGVLDIVYEAAAIGGFPAWESRADVLEISAVAVKVACLDDLIASKSAAGRDKDLRALPFLRHVKEQRER